MEELFRTLFGPVARDEVTKRVLHVCVRDVSVLFDEELDDDYPLGLFSNSRIGDCFLHGRSSSYWGGESV